jgi:hypothetical protein
MKITPKKKRLLILKIMITNAIQMSLFLYLLFILPLANVFPPTFKVVSMIGLWATTVIFLIAHITPEGDIKYKIWSRKE